MSEIQSNSERPSPADDRAMVRTGVDKGPWELSEALGDLSSATALPGQDASIGFLHSLRRQWLPGLGLGLLVGSLLATLMWFVIPANFTAESVLQVGRQSSFSESGFRTPQEFETYKKNQQQLLRSRVVIESALRDPKIMQLPMVQTDRLGRRREDPADWLLGALSVSYLGGDSALLRVALRGEDPKEVKAIVDKVVDSYMNDIVYKEKADRKNEMNILTKEIDQTRRDMDKILNEMSSLQSRFATTSSTVMQTKLRMFLDQLNELNSQRQDYQRLYDQAMQEYTLAQMQLRSRQLNPPQWMIDDVLKNSNLRFRMLVEQKEMLEQQVAMAEQSQSGGPSAVEALYNQLDELNFELDKQRRELRAEALDRLNVIAFPVPIEQEQVQLAMRQQQLQMYDTKLKELTQLYSDQLKKVEEFEDGSIQLQGKANDVERLSMAMRELEHRRKELSLRDQAGEQVMVVQTAMVPDVNNFWMKAAQVFGIALFSMLGTVALVAYSDFLGKRVNTRGEVDQVSHVPVLASVPQLTPVGSAALLPFGGSKRRTLELGLVRAIDSLRAILDRQRVDLDQRTLLVTSAGAQEGKTLLASQLAASCAKAGRRTLLIDADLHHPQLQSLVGVETGPGLAEVLRREVELDDAIHPLRVENLWFLQAGHRDASIDNLLNQSGAEELFRKLRSSYDFVIVDAGPVLGGPDCLLLSQHLDAALLSVRRDVSRRDKVEDACQRLKSIGSRVAGIIYCGGTIDLRDSELRPSEVATPSRRLRAPA